MTFAIAVGADDCELAGQPEVPVASDWCVLA